MIFMDKNDKQNFIFVIYWKLIFNNNIFTYILCSILRFRDHVRRNVDQYCAHQTPPR